jgi:hypothetical protein
MPKDITKNENNLSAKMRMERDMQVEIDNVDDLHRRISRILECDYIHTDELAALFSAITHAEGHAEAALSPSLADLTSFYERFFSRELAFDIADARHEHLFSRLYPHVSTLELISFYQSLIVQASPDAPLIASGLLGQTEPIESFARGNIAYQHSIYTDEAFLQFSRVLPTARAVYSDSFSGVCEQVFNGMCEYCILPLENTQDGKLVRFYELIQKYELKIELTCSVTTSDNRHSTVFGLCRRGLRWPELPLPHKDFCFEFLFWQEPEHVTLGELLTAASACSLTLVRADCLPRSDEEILMGAGYPFDICLEIAPHSSEESQMLEHGFLTFLLYLTLQSPTYLPLGIYQPL